jgi:hypothetical protein
MHSTRMLRKINQRGPREDLAHVALTYLFFLLDKILLLVNLVPYPAVR